MTTTTTTTTTTKTTDSLKHFQNGNLISLNASLDLKKFNTQKTPFCFDRFFLKNH